MTEKTYEYIGYRDEFGNILEEDDAQARVDAIGEPGLTITDLFQRVETDDFWQAEIDDQEANSPEPCWRFI